MSDPTPDRPTAAGIYDYALGGTANTAADRAVVERARQAMPELIDGAWANRGFLQRAVTRMAAQWGIRQFIDIGAGLPTQRNTHEVVADSIPDGRVVYVDHDPHVVARGREILADVKGAVAIQAALHHPEDVIDHPDTRRLIDFAEPVGLLLVAVTHLVSDADDPWAAVGFYVDVVAPGSAMALSAVTSDHLAERLTGEVGRAAGPISYHWRSRAEIERFFRGLEIVPPYQGAEPGLAHLGQWGAEDPRMADSDGSRLGYAAVGRKP